MWQVRPGGHWWCQTGHLRRALSRELFWRGAHSSSVCNLCIIYAFVSANYQPFYTLSFILQYISCDGMGCRDDSLWGKPITENSSWYWYQQTGMDKCAAQPSPHTAENLGRHPFASKSGWKYILTRKVLHWVQFLAFVLIFGHGSGNMCRSCTAAESLINDG